MRQIRKALGVAFAILAGSSLALCQTSSLQVNVTTVASSGTGSTYPAVTGVTSVNYVLAGALCTSHPSGGEGSIQGEWQLYVTYSGHSTTAPSISGSVQLGYIEYSKAYAHNSQSGASAAGSSYTFDTSNSASTGVGTDNPVDDNYSSPDPLPYIDVPANTVMGGTDMNWTYTLDLAATEAWARATLTGVPPGRHDSGSGSAKETGTLEYTNITVVTN